MRALQLSSGQFNLIYLAILAAFVYSWPYTVYGKLGSLMPQVTPRELLIVTTVNGFAKQRKIAVRPTFRVGVVAASAGAFSGRAVILVSPAMLDEKRFSDGEIRFILGHEIGHIERFDAYRFWTKWNRAWAERRELEADKIGSELAGCSAMASTIKNHYAEFFEGFVSESDPHPHPATRFAHACHAKGDDHTL